MRGLPCRSPFIRTIDRRSLWNEVAIGELAQVMGFRRTTTDTVVHPSFPGDVVIPRSLHAYIEVAPRDPPTDGVAP
jgi:hypothetical protein